MDFPLFFKIWFFSLIFNDQFFVVVKTVTYISVQSVSVDISEFHLRKFVLQFNGFSVSLCIVEDWNLQEIAPT